MATIKLRAKNSSDGECEVKAIMTHPMESGLRKDANSGELIPANHIREVICKHGDKTVLTANWGGAVSKNPYIAFKFNGAKKGESISLTWIDNNGASESEETQIR
ncbi:MAG: thiosulfate oxidation carrier complex protein SoxZ [Gammaproteobacteria bacterium]|nr:thiosulfate oxidation carrier complex protein SoxZ [Gammaproteobacteria bacterium]